MVKNLYFQRSKWIYPANKDPYLRLSKYLRHAEIEIIPGSKCKKMMKDIKPQHTQKLRMGHQICSIGKEVRGRKDSRDRRVDACQGRNHRTAMMSMSLFVRLSAYDIPYMIYPVYYTVYHQRIFRESLMKATREAL